VTFEWGPRSRRSSRMPASKAAGSSRARRDLARRCEGTASERLLRTGTNDMKTVIGKVPRGLTNEVQRRAKRVRCNAGLGWAPESARRCLVK